MDPERSFVGVKERRLFFEQNQTQVTSQNPNFTQLKRTPSENKETLPPILKPVPKAHELNKSNEHNNQEPATDIHKSNYQSINNRTINLSKTLTVKNPELISPPAPPKPIKHIPDKIPLDPKGLLRDPIQLEIKPTITMDTFPQPRIKQQNKQVNHPPPPPPPPPPTRAPSPPPRAPSPIPSNLKVFETSNQNPLSEFNITPCVAGPPVPPPPPPPPPQSSLKMEAKLNEDITNNCILQAADPQAPPVPLPPSVHKTTKKPNVFNWVNNANIEKSLTKTNLQASSPKENENNNIAETNKGPPIVAAPPTIERVNNIKEKDHSPLQLMKNRGSGASSNCFEENNQEMYDEDDDFFNEPWFFNVSKEDATEIMKEVPKKGAFLLRPSQDNQYVLMVTKDNKEVKKFKIQRHKNGWILGDPSETKVVHATISGLVQTYKVNGIKFGNSILSLKEPVRRK